MKYFNEKNVPPCQHNLCWKPWYADLYTNPLLYWTKYPCLQEEE